MGEGQQNVSPTVVVERADEKNSEKPLDKQHQMGYNKDTPKGVKIKFRVAPIARKEYVL